MVSSMAPTDLCPPPPSSAAASFTNAKTVVRENRNYDLQSVDCWRRWSSLRRMPTTANAAKGGGGGTLPAKKREAKRTEESQNDGEEEDEALRRDEWGRLIVVGWRRMTKCVAGGGDGGDFPGLTESSLLLISDGVPNANIYLDLLSLIATFFA